MSTRLSQQHTNGFSTKRLIGGSFILGVITLAIGSYLFQQTKQSMEPSKRIIRDYSLLNTSHLIENDFKGSYFMRLGYFSCDSSSDLMSVANKSEKILKSDGDSVEFIKVDFASSIGVRYEDESLVVTEAKNLRKDDYVILSHAISIGDVGLFKISDVDYERNRVKVIPTSFEESGSECRDNIDLKTLKAFLDSNPKANISLSQVSAVKFTLNQGKLRRQTWPTKNLAAIDSLEGIKEFSILGAWSPQFEVSEGQKYFGTMDFKIGFKVDEKAIVTSFNKSEKEKIIDAQYVLHDLDFDHQLPSTPSVANSPSEPSCFISHEFMPATLSFDPAIAGVYDNAIGVKITGTSTEVLNSPAIDISFSTSLGGSIQCFKHDPAGGIFSPPGPGVSGVLTLQQVPGGFETYTCAVRGKIGLAATMTYFDPNLNHIKSVLCESDFIEAPTRYRLNGYQKPSCKKSGEWSLGSSLSGDDSKVFFGNFGLDLETSCQWNDEDYSEASSKRFGSCNWWEHVYTTGEKRGQKRELLKVHLRPYRLDLLSQDGESLFSSGEAVVNCE